MLPPDMSFNHEPGATEFNTKYCDHQTLRSKTCLLQSDCSQVLGFVQTLGKPNSYLAQGPAFCSGNSDPDMVGILSHGPNIRQQVAMCQLRLWVGVADPEITANARCALTIATKPMCLEVLYLEVAKTEIDRKCVAFWSMAATWFGYSWHCGKPKQLHLFFSGKG